MKTVYEALESSFFPGPLEEVSVAMAIEKLEQEAGGGDGGAWRI